MNNYYELIYLKRELKEKIVGGFLKRSITPHKDVLECYLEIGSEEKRLIFSTNPNETALFLDRYRPPKKSNVVEFFKELEGEEITDVDLAEKDRLFYIQFECGSLLLFKLFSGNPNVYLVEEGQIADAFKNPGKVTGKNPPEPQQPSFAESANPEAKPKNQITRLNPLLPRNLINHLVDQHNVDNMDPEGVKQFVESITAELLKNPSPRVLVTGETTLWSEETLDIESEKTFDNVNETILYAYRNAVHTRRLYNIKDRVRDQLEKGLDKRENTLEELKQADKSLDRADRYERYGHLLMANAHREIDPGMDTVEVKDLYSDKELVEIPVKGDKNIAQNAEYYYDKAQASRKSYKKSKQRIGEVQQDIEWLKARLEELETLDHIPDLKKWKKKYKDKLKEFGFQQDTDIPDQSPYRKFSAGKYEIWIGKSARSNDQLTTLAHKEDIWLHARGVAGSHVVIRMGNRKDYPPKEVILKAAGLAAYYSKARGMKSVPVIYTKRKYVRKPTGADPGQVIVEREQVELVPPVNPKKL